MKKKVFFVISSLKAGGSERVFWLLSQGFDKDLFEVTVVILDSRPSCYSNRLKDVRFIDLQAKRAMFSVLKLYRLIRKEKPFAIFSTTDHINILTAFVSLFVRVPRLIARASNIPAQMRLYDNRKARFWNSFTRYCYRVFDLIVCQSDEMKEAVAATYQVSRRKLAVIPNPVQETIFFKGEQHNCTRERKLVTVARFSPEKGLLRLLETLALLPEEYSLTLVGDGQMRKKITDRIEELGLGHRVRLPGQIQAVADLIARHDLFVLSSFTEGFPNVVLESLSVGIPVVAFRVGGIGNVIRAGFNGFIVEQDDMDDFRKKIIHTCNQTWEHQAIKDDVLGRYALEKIADVYESLIA